MGGECIEGPNLPHLGFFVSGNAMEPTTASFEGYVCEACGDEGFTNAFVFCVNCLNFPIHRYCLPLMPKTAHQFVIWHCQPCKLESSQSQKQEPASSLHIQTTPRKKKQKKERNIASLIAATKTIVCQENIAYKTDYDDGREWFAHKLPKKKRSNRRKIPAFKQKKDVVEHTDESQPPKSSSCEREKLTSSSSFMEKEADITLTHACQAEIGTNVSQSPQFQTKDREIYNMHAQPNMEPVWRGSFTIVSSDCDQFESIFGHLSIKACKKVVDEAKALPSVLQVEMHPQTVLWPKSFQECAPSDDNIALYFFPGNLIIEKAFDSLVSDMVDEELAMSVTSKNAELLIFTSVVLHSSFWRFKEKYYLWGVFKSKRSDTASQYSPSIDVKRVLTRMKTLDACSPRSPLSNYGESGVDMGPESGD